VLIFNSLVRALFVYGAILPLATLCCAQTKPLRPPFTSAAAAAKNAPAPPAAHATSASSETLLVEHTKPSVLATSERDSNRSPLTVLREAPQSPLARAIRTRVMMQRAAVDSEQSAFRDLITGNASPISRVPTLTISPVRNVLNASILSGAAPGTYEKLRAIGFKVSRARTVRASLAESIPKIGVDQVWAQLKDGAERPVTGRGVTVGVIDTGVDYTHPDFGGCSRQQFLDKACAKVQGGYDFSANDPDPIDEHFHGTHVAGIIASNGSLKGVAPDAALYALRVLNRNGFGSSIDVIRAIEWATDPNGDGDLSDHLDVINLSLGAAGGTASDPDSLAVDAASKAGVVVVVAAGNAGPGPSTIGSPGAARSAITVGASAKDDTLADFSSRGPVMDGQTVIAKPDLVAPGVSICAALLTSASASTCSDSNHTPLSGTSMAAPHVTGVAALMKQANPNLSPAQVKTILRSTAVPLTSNGLQLDRNAQGAGRVDAKAAVEQAVQGSPAVVAYIATRGTLSDSVSPVVGDALGANFQRYDLFLVSNTTRSSTLLASSSSAVSNGTLGYIDTAALPSGGYSLRLEVRAGGTVGRDTSGISVQHLNITSPAPPRSPGSIEPAVFGSTASLPITGSVTGSGLTKFTLSLCWKFPDSAACSDSAITPAPFQVEGMRNAVLGTLTLDTVPVLRRGVYEVILSAHYSNRDPETTSQSFYLDPYLVRGFQPSNLCADAQPCENFGSQLVTADISGDSAAETIFTLTNEIHVVDRDGNNLPGWPRTVTETLLTPASVGDLDNDGSPEIIVQGYRFLDDSTVKTAIYAFHGDGSLVTGWPYRTQGPYVDLQHFIGDFLTVADIDNDGFNEVLVSPIEVLDHRGSLKSGWPTHLSQLSAREYPMFGGMLVADLDRDGRNEVVWGAINWAKWSETRAEDSVLVVQGSDGSIISKTALSTLFSSGPIAADIDGDATPEIITFERSNARAEIFVSARKISGALAPNWPVRVPHDFVWYEAIAGSLAAGDLDADGRAEIILQSDVPTTIIRSENGIPTVTQLANSPLSGFGSLVLANVDTDPSTEILFVSGYTPALSLGETPSDDPRAGLMMLVALDPDLALSPGFPILVPRSASWLYQFTAGDIDGDGEQEIVYPTLSSLLAIRTGGCANSREQWAAERGDPQRSAILSSAPMCSGGTSLVEACNRHTDSDFIDNCQDLCPTTERISPHAVCGCSPGDDDWDGDGVLTCMDGCPDDPEKTEPGPCGCFNPETDFNRNRVVDCLEDISITRRLSTPRPDQPPKIIRRSTRSITLAVPLAATSEAAQPRVEACIKPLGGKPTCRKTRSGRVTFTLRRAVYSLYYTWQYQGHKAYRSPRIKVVGGQKRKTGR